MAFAFDDATKTLYPSVDPTVPPFNGFTIGSRATPQQILVRDDIIGLLALAVPTRYWKVVAGPRIQEMTPAEKTTVDNASLPARRQAKIDNLLLQYGAYMNTRYRPELFEAFQTLLNGNPSAARATYLRTMYTWQVTVITAVRDAVVAVNAAATPAAIDAVTVNFNSFTATDPNITINGALAL